MEADVSVTPELDELLLGCDWLTKQGGSWDFKSGTFHLNGLEICLRSKYSDYGYGCRRVSVTESCTIPPHHEMNVPVKLEGQKAHQTSTEWALGAGVMRDGVLVAWTLFGGENNVKVARILNHTESPHELGPGDFVGNAEAVTVFQPPKPTLGLRGSGHTIGKNREWKMPLSNISPQRREVMRVQFQACLLYTSPSPRD